MGGTMTYTYLGDGTKGAAVVNLSAPASTPTENAILEQNCYTPFGTRLQSTDLKTQAANRWRYAGKEEQNISGMDLGLLDFGARYYDPYVARWTSIDPMAGNYFSVTPYNYSNCNPIYYADPDGKNPAVGGFIVGVGLDLAVQVASNIITKREDQSLIECFTDIDGMSLLKSGVSGAAGVGIIDKVKKVSAISKLGKLASATLETGSQAAAGAAIEAASEVVSGGSIDLAEVGKSAGASAFSSAAGNVAKSAILKSAAGQKDLKVAENQLDRAQRVARGDNPRSSRQNAVESAKRQIDNIGESSKRKTTNVTNSLLQLAKQIYEEKTY